MLRVTAPEFQGDGHTKWLLQHPETYAVRRVLAEQLIRSFFGVLWNEFHPLRSKVKLHVMAGPHAERALVKVHGSHWCWAEQGLAPAIPSKSKLGSVFLYNVEAVTLRRADLVSFFSSQVTPVVEPAEMTMRMRALGDGQAHLTEKAQAGRCAATRCCSRETGARARGHDADTRMCVSLVPLCGLYCSPAPS